jgi:NAD(P)-dependent dehydrogenase (short-subunit alcohol dehydrogenase family)
VASVAGYRGLPKALCYGPGKAALIHFAECLHLDLAPKGIGVWASTPASCHPAHRQERFRHACAADARAGGAGHHRRL